MGKLYMCDFEPLVWIRLRVYLREVDQGLQIKHLEFCGKPLIAVDRTFN